MKLYIQDENYHFDGFVSGVIIDDIKNKTALFSKIGVSEDDIKIDFDLLTWYELDSFEMSNNNVKIKAKNYAFYKEFNCLNIIDIKGKK